MAAPFEIIPLADRPEAIPQLAGWIAETFAVPMPQTAEYYARLFRGNLQRDRLPITFLAVRGIEVLGTASLDPTDLPSHDDRYSPWLASVFVRPASRSLGIAAALIDRVLETARGLGFPRVYLWTEDAANYYAKRGWRRLETADCGGYSVQIMVWEFDREPAQKPQPL